MGPAQTKEIIQLIGPAQTKEIIQLIGPAQTKEIIQVKGIYAPPVAEVDTSMNMLMKMGE